MKRVLDSGILIGIGLLIAFLIANAAIAFRNLERLNEDAHYISRTHEVLDLTGDVLLTLIDAETGQRGFLVTKKDDFLAPYHKASDRWQQLMAKLKEKTKDNQGHQDRVRQLEALSEEEFALLKNGIDLRRTKAVSNAALFGAANDAKKQMDAIRDLVTAMRNDEQERLAAREQQITQSYRSAVWTQLLTVTVGLAVIGAFAWVLERTLRIRRKAAAAVHEQREWLSTVLSSIGDGVIATDTSGRVTLLNDIAQTLTGWTEEAARGKPLQTVFKIVNEETRKLAEDPVSRVLESGTIVGLANHTMLIARDKTERMIDDSAAPIQNERRRIIGVVLVFRDVTQRRRAEEAIRQGETRLRSALEELRDADRKKNEFLAMLAHELRNPLAPIRNALQIMRMTENTGQSTAPVREMMDRQVSNLVRLVDDLLDVSRITTGNLELRKTRIEVAKVVESALETTRPLVAAANHQLTVTVPSQPIWLEADLTRLAQAVSNLLSNAAKYTPEGGHISLSVEQRANEIVMSVSDNGTGISADILPHIFELFTQADQSTERAQGGLGIGLTLVRRLVEMHGGSVTAKSRGLGQGSEFTIRLPMAAEPPPSSAPENDSAEGVKASGRRILVVDDNIDSAESLGLLLKVMGNEVRTAHDGQHAIDAAKDFRPEVILLDIGLPGMNGYEVARQMKRLPELKDAMLVAQTGWGQEEDRQRSAEAGFDAHLVKPVDQVALQGLLARVSL
jgi:PAS domain S-box-containing protein